MKTRLLALLAAAAILLVIACSDDDQVSAPTPPAPTSDRYVNQATGDDANGGSAGSPWKTISHAVATADSHMTIHVAPGTYDAASGETFPITLKKGQQLIGDTATKGATTPSTTIKGEAAYPLDQMLGTAVLGADDTRVAGFMIVTETNPHAYGGITADGVSMQIDHNTFMVSMYGGIIAGNDADLNVHDNLFQSAYYGLWLDGAGTVTVSNNTMQDEHYGIRAFGIDTLYVSGNTMSIRYSGAQGGGRVFDVHDNIFHATGQYGSVIAAGYSPVIRNNTFTGTAALYVQNDCTPDAGNVASLGMNDFAGITGAAVIHTGYGTVMAIGNTWAHNPPQMGVDIIITGTGTVVTN